jgi:hypothetical protein
MASSSDGVDASLWDDAKRFVAGCIFFSACIICTATGAENRKRPKYKSRKESVIATRSTGFVR